MTLEEIAKEIGVSKSTVSRALSGKGRIGEKTRNRILEVAKRGEEREEMARTRTVTHNIGVVLPSDVYYGSGVYFQNCLLGVCESASMLGYNVLITTSNAHDISELQSLVESNRVDGMLLTRALEDDRALQYLSQANFPTALTGTCRYDNIIQVDTDNEGAAEKMTTLLIGKGFRRFAFLVKDMSYNVDRKRHEGFCRALIKNGISEKDQLFYNGSIPYGVSGLRSLKILYQKSGMHHLWRRRDLYDGDVPAPGGRLSNSQGRRDCFALQQHQSGLLFPCSYSSQCGSIPDGRHSRASADPAAPRGKL